MEETTAPWLTIKPGLIPKYRLLGPSGLRVYPLCLGAMGFGKNFGDYFVRAAIFRRYIEEGGNFIDTACNYQAGDSERAIASLMRKHGVHRDEMVLATKYTTRVLAADRSPNLLGMHPKNMMRCVRDCCERLDTDYIDIIWWDWTCPNDMILRHLDNLVRSGKVLHIGLSDAPAWKLSALNTLAKCYNMEPFTCYQGKYSLLDRSIEQSIVPCCEEYNVPIVPWGCVASGMLCGIRKQEDLVRTYVVYDEKFLPVQEKVVEIAERLSTTEIETEGEEAETPRKVSPAQVALKWVMQKRGIGCPLVGARTIQQFEDTLAVVGMPDLSSEIMSELDEVSAPITQILFPECYIGTKVTESEWFDLAGHSFDWDKSV